MAAQAFRDLSATYDAVIQTGMRATASAMWVLHAALLSLLAAHDFCFCDFILTKPGAI